MIGINRAILIGTLILLQNSFGFCQNKFVFPLDTASNKRINFSDAKGKQQKWKKRLSASERIISYYKDDCLLESKDYYLGFLIERSYVNKSKDTAYSYSYLFSIYCYVTVYHIDDSLKRMDYCFRSIDETFPYRMQTEFFYKMGKLQSQLCNIVDISEFSDINYKHKVIQYYYRRKKLVSITVKYCSDEYDYSLRRYVILKQIELKGQEMNIYLNKNNVKN